MPLHDIYLLTIKYSIITISIQHKNAYKLLAYNALIFWGTEEYFSLGDVSLIKNVYKFPYKNFVYSFDWMLR